MPQNKPNKGGENCQKCLVLFKVKKFRSLNELSSKIISLRGLVDFKTLNPIATFGKYQAIIDNKRLLFIGDFQNSDCLKPKIKVQKSLSPLIEKLKLRLKSESLIELPIAVFLVMNRSG